MIAAIINIVVDLALIKVIGMYAAPLSSVCGYMTISFWRLRDVNKRHCKISMSKKKITTLTLLYVITTAGFYSGRIEVQLILLGIVVAAAIWMNYAFLKQFAVTRREN